MRSSQTAPHERHDVHRHQQSPTPGITDGLRVDRKGNLYETAAGGVWIISPEGRYLGTILTPELAANGEFGDPRP
ncbi:MAG TPA: hypothetical protein VGK65_08510 [Candidatus Binatia bacterium]|jgi:gluconolactonase